MFRALKKVRASEQVAREVLDRILDGGLAPGARLPGERDLADQFGVNRSTVREALKSLSELGLVVVRHGGGAVVQDYLLRGGLQLLPHLFERGEEEHWLRSLLEVRRMFAVETTRLAAERASPEDRAELAALVEALAAAEGDLAQFQALDYALVQRLALASDNAILLLVINSVRPIYEEHAALFAPLYEERAPIVAAYRQLAKGLTAGDARLAARAMDQVMRRAEEIMEARASGKRTSRRSKRRSGGEP